MQPIGAFGVIPQLVNPQVVVAPGGSSRRGSKGSKKGSCSSCGRCIGSLFIILFAIICTSCCYAYPVYNSFTNPDYFKHREKPLWTWDMALKKVRDLGYSVSLMSPPAEEDKGDIKKASNSSEPDRRIDDSLIKNASNIIQSNVTSSSFMDVLNSTMNRKLSIRGAAGFQNDSFYFMRKATPNKYFNREYCVEGDGVWSEFCRVKHNVTNLECIDMLNGPAICVGIRDRRYEVFSVSKECKFLEPEVPVEIFPTISSFCSSSNGSKKGSLLCPCLITSNPVESIFNSSGIGSNFSLIPGSNSSGTVLNKLVSPEGQKQLRGSGE